MHKMTMMWAALAALAFTVSMGRAQDVDTRATPDAATVEAIEKTLGGFKHPQGTTVNLFAAEPLLMGPVALDIDYDGRVYVAETGRFWEGVADNRRRGFWLLDDLAAQTIADRQAYYDKWAAEGKVASEWYTKNHDQLRRITDTDGDGRADESHVLARFNEPLDGLASGVLAERGEIYVTNIPHLWKLRDADNDGKAEVREKLSTGYGVRTALLGHDLHGLTWGPDGKLYFSIGDRGFNVTTPDGRNLRDKMDVGRGAVFRCKPDGSELEVFAWGLRNPQELAFDDYGNLWTGDNNSDAGDKARLVYVVEQGDSGWAMSFQTLEGGYRRGPWNQEKLWHTHHENQPAWIVPPVAHISNGPSGFVHYPGLGLPEKYKGYFFLCDYKGSPSRSGVWAFTVEPDGAGFAMKDAHPFWWNFGVTDVDFGYDGKMYASDWVSGWELNQKGRVYTLQHDEAKKDPRIAATAKLVREGLDKRSDEELIGLLGHADQRVRLRAQFELTKRKAWETLFKTVVDGKGSRLQQIHAIWAIAHAQGDEKIVPRRNMTLAIACAADDPEIRAQALRAIGWARDFPAAPDPERGWKGVALLLSDAHPRVRYFAAMALGKHKVVAAIEPLVGMLRDNDDKDVYLRHAAVVSLSRIGDADALFEFAGDQSRAVRLGVLLTLRRMDDARVAIFLKDPDHSLVVEAARAIHDLPIDTAIDAMADMLGGDLGPIDDNPQTTFALHRRILNSAFRRGTPTDAARLAAYAADTKHPLAMRREAIAALSDFAEPGARDRVLGFYRPLPKRDAGVVTAAVQPLMKPLLDSDLKAEATVLAVKYRVPLDRDAMVKQVADEGSPATFRIAALRALKATASKEELSSYGEAIRAALASDSSQLRAEAIGHAAHALGNGREIVLRALTEGTIGEKQVAIQHLKPLDRKRLKALVGQLANGSLDAPLRLDVYRAAKGWSDLDELPAIGQIMGKLLAGDLATLTSLTVEGGDAARGESVFLNHAAAQCQRCHAIDGVGGEAGPDLSTIGKLRDREYLVRAIVAPQAEVAAGYGTISVTLKDGTVYAGTIRGESDGELTMLTPDGKTVTVAVGDIASRTPPISAMPPMTYILTPHELRDVVAYLATLRSERKNGAAHGE